MELNLEPTYSTNEISGKCIKCLAEEELNSCLRKLLGDDAANTEDLKQRFEMLVAFLKSPDSEKLRVESENCLAEGKKVILRLSYDSGKPKYELKIVEEETKSK